MAEHVNREDVRKRIERLRDDYGDVVVFESEGSLPAERFERMHADAREGYTGSGYAWVRREPEAHPPLSESMDGVDPSDQTQVLLALERGVGGPTWEVAGGGREDGETYATATERELREETGIDATVGEPYLAYVQRMTPESGDPDVCLHTLWVCFDATYEGGSIAVQSGELRGAAWFESPPAALGPWAQYRAVDWWDGYAPDDRWWADLEPR